MSRAAYPIAALATASLLLGIVACTGGSDPPGADGGSSGSSGSSGSTGTVGGTIAASEFDRNCSIDTDCVAVHQGSVCDACKCQNAAIAQKDLATFQAAVEERSKSCPPPPPCAADCADPGAYCKSGTCALGPKPKDAGTGG